jgi:hypothetical protein
MRFLANRIKKKKKKKQNQAGKQGNWDNIFLWLSRNSDSDFASDLSAAGLHIKDLGASRFCRKLRCEHTNKLNPHI